MEKKPSIDLGVLGPIALGLLSIAGILAVYFFGVNASRPVGETVSTETPFRYVYLGTEPGLSTLTPEPTLTPIVIIPVDPADFPPASEPPFLTSVPPLVELSTRPPVRTSTPTATETLQAVLSKFDDTYYEILYNGDWTSQSNVTDTYQNTLHISFKAGNNASFTFVGQQVIVTYQAGPSLGRISINLDGLIVELDQANTTSQLINWTSPILVKGTHTIIITHLSGGSVNLDSITIPDISTPTPTPTVTP